MDNRFYAVVGENSIQFGKNGLVMLAAAHVDHVDK